MDDGDADLSARARMRAAAQKRRQARARERGEILDLVVSGYTYEAIADSLKLSVKSVRRAVAKAIEQRQLDGGAHYVHLQVLRLTKAMRVVDLNLEEGDLKAVEPMLKVIAQLDRYHALSLPAPPRLPPRPRRSRWPARRWPSPRPTRSKSGPKKAPKRLKSPDAGQGFVDPAATAFSAAAFSRLDPIGAMVSLHCRPRESGGPAPVEDAGC